jgi:hypothetical protein
MGSGSGSSHAVPRTIGVRKARASVASANSPTRPARPRPACHNTAAATIARPITLRMSTFSRLTSGPQPSTCDCRRNRNASPSTCQPR